jgi:hypothetical protein
MLAGSYGLGTQQVQIIAMDEPEPDGGFAQPQIRDVSSFSYELVLRSDIAQLEK